jgi:lipopolysaccharide/colanic/teichoic acid biosynthesis glycosyltransferase
MSAPQTDRVQRVKSRSMGVNLAKKRAFDLVVCLIAAPLWVPLFLVLALVNWVFSGLPIFYKSDRRIFQGRHLRVLKFRTMVRNASQIANRETIPVDQQAFLNIPATSPLYTPVGRLYERFSMTELPQLWHVVSGKMSLVGSRPLPENVISALKEKYSNVEERFLTKAGLTGFAQVMHRDCVPDDVRLKVESAYCQHSLETYSVRLDLLILLYTVFFILKIRKPLTGEEVENLLRKYSITDPHLGTRLRVLRPLNQ